ncbi:MAG TPA: chorismate-binding protein, partial [Pontiella sp.]
MKVVLRHAGRWLHFQSPEKVLVAESPDQVLPMLCEAEESGLYAAGFISYEAAPAFDDALQTRPAGGFPLLCIGLFHAPYVLDDIELTASSSYMMGTLKASVSKQHFAEAIARIRERIAAGATYQVNYTYRLNASFEGDPWSFFYRLVRDQRAEYAAYIETDEFSICSASPELFFHCRNGVITSRPMKGTARRGRTFSEDRQQAEELAVSEKDRAENIMIVDMIRNDIGRVAEPGSVETLSLYDVEKYPTVWQMTSTVAGKINHESSKNRKLRKDGHSDASGSSCLRGEEIIGLTDVFTALFPCASITGAPKAKTMEIIRELETSSRKIYTGSIGFLTPQGEACFNVAIRTALIDRKAGTLEYGVGGGIVWDSDAAAEYEETLTKARILTQPRPDFQLLETMLWEPAAGIFLLDGHLQRLGRTAAYFDVPLDVHAVLSLLESTTHGLEKVPHRIRLLVSCDGSPELQTFPLETGGGCFSGTPREAETAAPAVHVEIAKDPVDPQHIFLFHKTTHRDVYTNARAAFPDSDDVILWNERGEVTESTIANVVIRKNGRLITPPVGCGLLAGVFREHLLQKGEIEEGIVTLEDLR